MINDNTILSSFNDRPTLLEWLKKVEEALKTDTATAFHVNNRGNATLTFSIDFADGSSLESDPIVLQQGESVNGAEIRSGHLILTLTNGDELDAGNIFVGNISVDGSFKQTLPNYAKPFEFVVSNPIFEVTNVYNRFIVINNILYIIANIKIRNTSNESQIFDRVPTAFVATFDNQDIYNNVFDIDGNTIGNTQNNRLVFIAGDQAILLKGGTNTEAIRSVEQNYSIIAYNTDSPTNKSINVFFEKNNGATDVTLGAGESLYLSGRVALTLM